MKIIVLYSLSLLLLLGSCSSHKKLTQIAPDSHISGLKVMTYNIHHANPPSRDKSVIDLDTIAGVIRRVNPDLVALQELDSATIRTGRVFQLKLLADKLGMHYYYGRAIAYEGGAYGVGILSKYPITETFTYPLPKMANVESETRALALVKLSLAGNHDIWFGTAHLDVVSEQNRELQANRILEITGKLGAPVILCGDFNATDKQGSIQTLFKNFTDASLQKQPTIPARNPRRRIDYILYSPASHFQTIGEQVPQEQYASDHLPFCAELKWNKTEK